MRRIENDGKPPLKERLFGPEPSEDEKRETVFWDGIGAIIVLPIAFLLIYWFK